MTVQQQSFSKVKEVVAAWHNIRQLLRSGEGEHLVPVIIPKSKRGFGWLFWFALAFWLGATLVFSGSLWLAGVGIVLGLFLVGVGFFSWWQSARVEIEEGTTGIYSRFGKIEGTLSPGLKFLWWPWEKVEYIVDTSTEIPYTAPVLAAPTRENVPLKSIEFFLKFRIEDPVKFVQKIGATNFDAVLSSAVQDAIRQRSRRIETVKAYDLRGSDVEDMRNDLNRQMERYGVRIIGANIPDVQLPDQYRENLATRERIAKELAAYEKEWELIRKRKTDTILMEIERAKKERDEKIIAVKEAINKARQEVAQMLQERETDAEKIRLEIEAAGRAQLKAAENEARALVSLGQAYQDNQAILKYQLELQALKVAENLLKQAPRPVLVNSQADTAASPLATLLLAEILPNILKESNGGEVSNRLNMSEWMEGLAEEK
jgi:regulator of protease activity HflC (stomatin/prohibitin superfamily)